MVGQTQTPNSSSLRSRFRLDWKGLVKSSGLKCTEHIEEVFPGVQCLRVSFTNFIHRCLLRRTSGLGYQKESYACWTFLFISRVAASKNHTFFNHFLCLTIKHYRESLHIFARCPFLTSRSIFGHIWPSGGLMRTIGENIDKTAFTSSARKKKGFNISKKFFRKWVLERYGNLPKEKKLKG